MLIWLPLVEVQLPQNTARVPVVVVKCLWLMAGIAAKSPLAITGTKTVLLRSRDMSVDQALDYVATWNSAVLLSDDLTEAVSAQRQKRKPLFAKL